MNQEFLLSKPKILVAPLDWGLGHATRCIPLIRRLICKDCEVLLAAEGRIANLLRTEFPQLRMLPLKGYNINYGETAWQSIGKILLQIPKIINAIEEEQEWLEQMIEEHQLNAVISDNRYGLNHKDLHSVIITHQLLIKTSLGKMADEMLQGLHYQYINEFNQCWVPDAENEINLAGDLSHPEKKPSIPVSYIGPQSRFEPTNISDSNRHLLVILSGPEPQRTIMENDLLDQLVNYTEPVLFVRGLPGNIDLPTVSSNISIINHLPSVQLEEAIRSSEFIISRCGYSTVMDMMIMQKKTILIPTPGQTEQEYLSSHLMNKRMALCIPQNKFKLKNAIELAKAFNYQKFDLQKNNASENAINDLIKLIGKSET
ncbi:MAG: glycosyl transferase family 28 [Bacteroidota bacterium]|nr:glycosyl transferase family 28 [Bacteroidota bacterium]